MIINTGYAWGLGQDIAGAICTDASGNGVPCVEPPATGSGYQQWASGSIRVAPGAAPGSEYLGLSIPGALSAPISGTGTGSGTGGSGSGSNTLCTTLFGTGAFGQTMCSGWFWIAVLVVGGIVVYRFISRR